MAVIEDYDYDILRTVPCHALGSKSLAKLSSGLNVEQVLPGRGGHCRDWRVLAELVLHHDRLMQLRGNPAALEETLKAWPREATIDLIITTLEAVERFDVIDDCIESFLEDCRNYESRRTIWGEPSFLHASSFRAFVVHSPEAKDTNFVMQLVKQVETNHVRLFIPARDFPAAMSNYLHRLKQIMEHRCSKIIIVISRALGADEDSMSLVMKAEEIRAMQSGITNSKVIPVILEQCPKVGSSLISISPVNFRSHNDWGWLQLKRALDS